LIKIAARLLPHGCAYLRLKPTRSCGPIVSAIQKIDPPSTRWIFNWPGRSALTGCGCHSRIRNGAKFDPKSLVHYQLSQLYQRAGRADDAAREMQLHQQVLAKIRRPSGPATFERCKYTSAHRVQAGAAGSARIRVRFVAATATRSVSPQIFTDRWRFWITTRRRNSLFVREGEAASASSTIK